LATMAPRFNMTFTTTYSSYELVALTASARNPRLAPVYCFE